jgi:hypothetical protein
MRAKPKLTRDQQLVRAAKARAIITSHLTNLGYVAAPDEIFEEVRSLGYSSTEFNAMLYRMADAGLIKKEPVEHPDYEFGYSCPRELVETMPATHEKKEKAKPQHKVSKEIPIDIRANKDGSITVRYAGLLLTVSKEGA